MNEPRGGKTDTLSPDRLPRLDEVNREVFEDETSDIFKFIKSETNKIQKRESQLSFAESQLSTAKAVVLARAREKFVNNAEFAELANLADIIITAPQAEIIQEGLHKISDRLDDLRIKKDRGGELTEQETEERKQLLSNRKLEVAKILPFNHMLRELIDTFADVVSRETIEDTIEKALSGAGGTARKIVAGMGTEVAVARVARELFGPKNVRLSTQQEDAKGIDIVIMVGGKEIQVDVKTGGNIGDGHGSHKEVSVDQDQLKGFDVLSDQKQDIKRKLEDVAR
jgi:hypothetical protein